MNAPLRASPLYNVLAAAQWTTINQMQVASHIGTPTEDRAKLQTIALADLSHLKRCGLKGPVAEAWLKSVDIEPPTGINQWAPLGKCGLIARLAASEFFIEDSAGQAYADPQDGRRHRDDATQQQQPQEEQQQQPADDRGDRHHRRGNNNTPPAAGPQTPTGGPACSASSE